MKMYFHGGYNEVILFDFWRISTLGGLIGSMIGCFILGILYEGLKFLREFLIGRELRWVMEKSPVWWIIKILQDDFLHKCFLQPCGHFWRGRRFGLHPLQWAGHHEVTREEAGGGAGEDHPDQHSVKRSPPSDTPSVCPGWCLLVGSSHWHWYSDKIKAFRRQNFVRISTHIVVRPDQDYMCWLLRSCCPTVSCWSSWRTTSGCVWPWPSEPPLDTSCSAGRRRWWLMLAESTATEIRPGQPGVSLAPRT